jgi:O-antigen ligase
VGHPKLRHAHNGCIDLALEVGAIGLAAFLGLLGALAWRYRAMLADPALAPLGVMGLALLAGFVVKNLTDDFLHRQNGVLFWALNGMLLGLAAGARAPRRD